MERKHLKLKSFGNVCKYKTDFTVTDLTLDDLYSGFTSETKTWPYAALTHGQHLFWSIFH